MTFAKGDCFEAGLPFDVSVQEVGQVTNFAVFGKHFVLAAVGEDIFPTDADFYLRLVFAVDSEVVFFEIDAFDANWEGQVRVSFELHF